MEMSGAISDKDKYSELFLGISRSATLLGSIIAVVYGVAVVAGIAPASPLYSYPLAMIIFMSFAVFGILQYILRPSKSASLSIFIGIFHILFVSYLLFVSGAISPIAFSWIVIALITEIFFGRFAAILSLTVLATTFTLLYVLEPVPSATQSLDYIVYLLIILVSSGIIMLLHGVQTVEHADLKRSQGQESFERDRLTALINSLNAAILSITTAGTVRVYNAALLNLVDTNQSLSGKNVDDVLNLYDDNGEPVSLIDLLHASQKSINRDDLTHRFSDGETIRLDISCAPIRGQFGKTRKQRKGYILVLRDITQAKSLEEERNEFISVVSHELRTPITIAEGSLSNLQLLMQRKQDPKLLAPAVKDAHSQIIYLANMVNDLSTLSRAERGVADTPEKVDIRALLDEIYHRYHHVADDKKLDLNVDTSHDLGTIVVSRLYLEEILQNFVTNAIKYTQRGSVNLSAHRTGRQIEFVVQDTGIGISKSEQRRIFEKFYRSEDYRTRETSGTGLGLYVVHKLADKMSASIKFQSRLNHGSRFSLILDEDITAADTQNNLDETAVNSVHLT